MKIQIESVDITDKKILSNLIQEYQKEILKQGKVEEYKYLDSYWQEASRRPYFIKVDAEIAGFVLVNNYYLVEKEANSISEFYIKNQFRHKGIGKQAAFKIFDLFPGKWEIRELTDNIPAQEFWRKVIDEYTNGDFKEIILDIKDWHGPVQTFATKVSIPLIHHNFVPKYDRWHGKLYPRIVSWFEHVGEIVVLFMKWNKPYSKHGKTIGTCREHALVEIGDLLYLSCEIFYMVTRIELHLVPEKTLQRVWNKMEENKTAATLF